MIELHCDFWHLCRVSNMHCEGGERKLVVLWFFTMVSSGI